MSQRPLVLIAHHADRWVQAMVADSISQWYKGPATVKSINALTCDKKEIQRADLIVVLYWLLALRIEKRHRFPIDKTIVSIRGVSGLPMARVPKEPASMNVAQLTKRAQAVICSNASLVAAWKKHHPHVYVGYSAMDPRWWFPPESFKPITNPLVVGWTGNASRGDKRVETVLRPAIAAAGDGVALLIQDGSKKQWIPYQEMREKFYHRIDLLAITSKAEGTPNPVLEAMACGVPIVSTPVGHVPELIVHNKNGWMATSIKRLAAIFRWLANRPEEIEKRRSLVIETARKWSWEYRIKDWQIAIDETLRRMRRL